jgi:hypothetical protein
VGVFVAIGKCQFLSGVSIGCGFPTYLIVGITVGVFVAIGEYQFLSGVSIGCGFTT